LLWAALLTYIGRVPQRGELRWESGAVAQRYGGSAT